MHKVYGNGTLFPPLVGYFWGLAINPHFFLFRDCIEPI